MTSSNGNALLAICAENSPVPGEFPAQRPVTPSFDVFFFICARINGCVNNREAGGLRRYSAHYDVTAMSRSVHVSATTYTRRYQSPSWQWHERYGASNHRQLACFSLACWGWQSWSNFNKRCYHIAFRARVPSIAEKLQFQAKHPTYQHIAIPLALNPVYNLFTTILILVLIMKTAAPW